MKILDALKKIFFNSCVIFTFAVLVLYTSGYIVGGNNLIPTLPMIYMVLAFSFFISITSGIFRIKKLNVIIKIIIHFIVTAGSFYVIFILMSGIYKNSSTTLVAMSAFTAAYIVIAVIVFLIKKSVENRRINKTAYKNQFDENLKDKH